MADFLLEIYTEETPARMQNQQIYAKIIDIFCRVFKVEYNSDILAASPVRLVFSCEILENFDTNEEIIRGPKISANQNAVDGFLKKYNTTIDSLIKNGEYYQYIIPAKSIKTCDILPEKIKEFLFECQNIWPKSMRWNSNFEWIRPIRNICTIFNGKSINFEILGIKSTNLILGHKFANNITRNAINSSKEYFEFIKNSGIILNIANNQSNNRVIEIEKQIKEKCDKLSVKYDISSQKDIITETAGLCEIPYVIIAKIDEKFKILPPEVIHTVIRNHQKYIPLNHEYFAIVVDKKISHQNEEDTILAGNMKVLKARLEDALFFYNKDIGTSIEVFENRLKNIIFHPKIGNIFDRINRINWFFDEIKRFIDIKNEANAIKTINCMKLDLGTEMVSEFPELQGFMVKHYFNKNEACIYQYKNTVDIPEISQDECAIILAEWLEYCMSLLCADEEPTSSRDPFGIRRRLKNVSQLIDKFDLNIKADDLFSIADKFSKTFKYNWTNKQIQILQGIIL